MKQGNYLLNLKSFVINFRKLYSNNLFTKFFQRTNHSLNYLKFLEIQLMYENFLNMIKLKSIINPRKI